MVTEMRCIKLQMGVRAKMLHEQAPNFVPGHVKVQRYFVGYMRILRQRIREQYESSHARLHEQIGLPLNLVSSCARLHYYWGVLLAPAHSRHPLSLSLRTASAGRTETPRRTAGSPL